MKTSLLHRIKKTLFYGAATFTAATLLVFVNNYESTAVAASVANAVQYAEPETQLELAKAYLTGGIKNQEKGFALIEEVAALGDPEAQFQLGLFYDPMIGVYFKNYITLASDELFEQGKLERNGERAKALYEMAAEQGHGQAMTALGVMYMDGSTVPESLAIAHRWFKEGCDREHELACTLFKIFL